MENSIDQIQQIVDTAVNNIRQAAEINTIVGQPIVTLDGSTILPISQVTFAFVAGGGQYGDPIKKSLIKDSYSSQFAGGSGGGATLTPVGFLVITRDGIKMVNSVETSNLDKVVSIAQDLLKKM